ncbi:hypothetical protein Tco_0561996 [Tanacetum coccineum]
MELKTVSNFKISGLLQAWQTLCKIFSKCLTTRVTGWESTDVADNSNVILLCSITCHVHARDRCPYPTIFKLMEINKQYDHQEETRTRLDVPLTQSQPTEFTQGTHRTPSAPSLAEHKSHEEQEARENVALVYDHLAAEEIEKLVENPENEKEEETTKVTEVEPDIVIPANVDDEEDEITDEVFELRIRAKGKNV